MTAVAVTAVVGGAGGRLTHILDAAVVRLLTTSAQEDKALFPFE